jgi:hypothetical protein
MAGRRKQSISNDGFRKTPVAAIPRDGIDRIMTLPRKILLPSLAAFALLLLPSCIVVPGPYYGPPRVYAPGVYEVLPPGYAGPYYWVGGRYYYGGRHEVGRFYWHGRYYSNRYYHNGHYYYGGRYYHGHR